MSVTEPLQQFAAVFFEPFFLRAIGWKNTFNINFVFAQHFLQESLDFIQSLIIRCRYL